MSDGGRDRPRPRARVMIDPDNAYARLGVSPLSSTEEIKNTLLERGNKLRQAARKEGGNVETDALVRLQAIENEIGSPKARLAYDQRHPQNELLTVQPSPRDRWLDSPRRAELVAAWLLAELGDDAAVLSPSSLAWWAPSGVSDELREALGAFLPAGAAPEEARARGEPEALEVEELADLGARKAAG